MIKFGPNFKRIVKAFQLRHTTEHNKKLNNFFYENIFLPFKISASVDSKNTWLFVIVVRNFPELKWVFDFAIQFFSDQ